MGESQQTVDSSVEKLTARLVGGRQNLAVIGAVIVSTFFIGFGAGVVFPILPNLGQLLGISPLVVGLILSANRFSRLVANAPAGALVDRIGTRRPFITGMFIQSIGTVGYVIALAMPLPEVWFLLARVLWGVGSALVFATAFTIAADVSGGDSRGANMGLIRGGLIFGFPTGIVLGGLVSEIWGNAAAFGVAAVFAGVATLVAYALVPETHIEDKPRRSVRPWAVNTSTPALTVGLVNFALFFVYIGALFATLVLFLPANDLGVFDFGPQASSGIFMAVTVLSAGAFMFLGGYVTDRRQSRVPTLVLFLVVTVVGFLLLAAADSVVTLTVACIFIGAGQGGTSGPLMALLADLTPAEEMGRAVGTNNVFGDIGGGIGPIISLPLVDVVGFWPVYLACAFIPLGAVAVLLTGVYRSTGEFVPRVGRRD